MGDGGDGEGGRVGRENSFGFWILDFGVERYLLIVTKVGVILGVAVCGGGALSALSDEG